MVQGFQQQGRDSTKKYDVIACDNPKILGWGMGMSQSGSPSHMDAKLDAL